MILLYPDKYKENLKSYDGVDIRYYHTSPDDYHVDDNGLYDIFILEARHNDDEKDLNYHSFKWITRNCHVVKTSIDCRYPSKNLDMLVEKFKKIEDIWNE